MKLLEKLDIIKENQNKNLLLDIMSIFHICLLLYIYIYI
jgi:hypothetical protein